MKSKYPWVRMKKKTDPELPLEPPIWMGDISNGEYFKFQTPRDKKLRKLVLDKADENAQRVGIDRREFLASAMGMATTLWCINYVSGCSSDESSGGSGGAGSGGSGGGSGGVGMGDGGPLCVPPEAMFDEDVACSIIDGSEFIFDVQTHWFKESDTERFPQSVKDVFGALFASTTEERYITEMFLNSSTDMAVLTAWPGSTCSEDPTNVDPCGLPLSNESMRQSRDDINRLACNTQRVIQHVQVLPNDPTGIERQKEIMTQIYCEQLAYGWKMYPGFSAQQSIDPNGAPGYFLDDPLPREAIEHGLSLGLNRFCVHKGLPIGNFFDPQYNYPREIGIVANDYKDARFIIYHSAINAGYASTTGVPPEGEYDPNEAEPKGVNALIRSLLDAGIEPGSNVYAEVGSAINQLQTDATAAAHFFGKLMKYVGVERVLWGTDCVLYGSPENFINWFRALQIPESMQTEYGYPALDATAKSKILGLNAAALYDIDVAAARCQINSCETAQLKRQFDEEFGKRRWVFQRPGGPKTWGEFVEHSRRQRAMGRPG